MNIIIIEPQIKPSIPSIKFIKFIIATPINISITCQNTLNNLFDLLYYLDHYLNIFIIIKLKHCDNKRKNFERLYLSSIKPIIAIGIEKIGK